MWQNVRSWSGRNIPRLLNSLKIFFELIWQTFQGWSENKAPMLAAGLSYYTIFSLAPLLVLTVAIASLVYGEQAAEGQLVAQIEDVVGPDTAVFLENLIGNASQSTSGVVATVISLSLLFFGASNIFGQLKTAINLMWGITPLKTEGLGGIVLLFQTRLVAVVMVLMLGFLLLLSIALNAAVGAVGNILTEWNPLLGRVLPLISLTISLTLLTGVFSFLFRALPDTSLSWRDVGIGSLFTALLFSLGQYGLGKYLGGWTGGAAYGAASSLILLLFWIYLSGLIILFGAEFTHVYAHRFGAEVNEADAISVSTTTTEAAVSRTTDPLPTPPPMASAVTPPVTAPPKQWPKQIATGLIGLAIGLTVSFLNNLKENKPRIPQSEL